MTLSTPFTSVQSSHYIGRVGGLAVALGIGTAILSLSGVASADSGPGTRPGESSTAGPAAGAGSSAPVNPRGKSRSSATPAHVIVPVARHDTQPLPRASAVIAPATSAASRGPRNPGGAASVGGRPAPAVISI